MTNASAFLAHQRIHEAQREASEARQARLARAERAPGRTLLSRLRGIRG